MPTYFDSIFESSSITHFSNNVAKKIVLDYFDASQDMGAAAAHDGNFFHVEKVLGNFVIDCFDVNNFDSDIGVVFELFS